MDEHEELLLLRDAIQATNNIVLRTDPNLPDNPIVYVNEGFERLTGYSRDEVIGRNCRFLQGDDHEQEGVARLREAITKRESVRVEVRNYRKDGSLFWNELYVTPIFEGDDLKFFLGVLNDATARKDAEENQALFLQAIADAQEALVVTEAQLELPGPRIQYVNEAFTRMTGYIPEEVLGRTPRIFQGPRTDRTVLARMRRRLEQGKNFSGETINYRKDGSSFVLAWTASPVRDVHGNVTRWISSQQDVTERRRLERETLDISAREQRRIAGELHDALQQQLIGTSMHGLHLARALAERDDAQSQEARELYDLMQENVKSLRTVIQGVAPVQQSENGLMVALENLSAKLRELYGVDSTFTYESPVLVRDFELAAQLYYIAQEAATNAAKHAEAEHVELSLAHADADGSVALSVRDNGLGFDADMPVGTGGLGLRLMAYRARLVDAELEVTSQPGQGTSVTCVFKSG
jgi:PAS domain S-box-containing protein